MITYQDLLEVGDREDSKMEFVLNAIHQHKSTRKYDKGVCAEEYYRHQNRTIMQFQKLLYTVSGKAVPDNWSANYKLASNFYKIFVTQQVQFLLGNGISWTTGNGDILGSDFDIKVQEATMVSPSVSSITTMWKYSHLKSLRLFTMKRMVRFPQV